MLGVSKAGPPLNLRTHHLIATLLTGAIVLSSLAYFAADSPVAQATCASGASVVITAPAANTASPLSGIINVRATSTPTNASGLSFMLLSPVQQSIGEATLSGTNWTFNWDTRNHPNGAYQLMAMARFGTATSLNCASPAIPVMINNLPTQQPSLAATIAPTAWQGPVGASSSFAVDTLYTDQFGRLSHVSPVGVNWHSDAGATAPNGGITTVFRAGTVAKTGTVVADVTYNSLVAHAVAAVRVGPAGTVTTTPAPTPTPTAFQSGNSSPTPSPLSPGEAARLAAMPTIFRPAAPTNSDPVVSLPTLGCLEKAVGAVRFAEISSGKSQPTAAERKLAANCFGGSEAIPTLLAPVAPTKLTELATTKDIVSVGAVKNQVITTKDGKKVSGLLINGKAAPNSSVFIYVFSDPLVLRAETDAKGEWSYVLENPLPEGKHEVYAVAEKDASTFVRTSAVPIQVAAAAPGAADGSLVVEGKWSTQQVALAGGAALLTLVALGLTFTLVRRRKPLATPAAIDQPVAPASVLTPGAPTGTAPAQTTFQPSAPAPSSTSPAPAPGTAAAPVAKTDPAPATPQSPTPTQPPTQPPHDTAL